MSFFHQGGSARGVVPRQLKIPAGQAGTTLAM